MMNFFKVNKFKKAHKPKLEIDSEDKPIPLPEEPINENGDVLGKSVNIDNLNVVDNSSADTEDDDDDFITNEVKRRLKELRKNSFMVLIPEEEPCNEDEEGGEEEEEEFEVGSTEWRDVEAEGRQYWSGFDAIYERYCERMLFYDRSIPQLLNELGCQVSTTASLSLTSSAPSPKSLSKKVLMSPFRHLSFKKPEEETEKLRELGNDPYQDLEASYVAQICLTWEALHCQYTQLSHKISHQPENQTAYNQSAQEFQQFHVLLQRFTENEPYQEGSRPEVYARTRNSLCKLLQVPKIQGSDQPRTEEDKEEPELLVHAPDLLKIVEISILTFYSFLKMDKKKPGGVLKFFAGSSQNQTITPIQQIQFSLEKKVIKLKELRKKRKNWKEKSWPTTQEDTHLLLGLIDVKVLSRVLRMVKIGTDQLIWCEEKMKKLCLSDGNLQRDPSPILF